MIQKGFFFCFFLLFTNFASTQTCIELPAIDNSTTCGNCVASGYSIVVGTPDIINGNGVSPVTSNGMISEVSGISNSNGKMALLLDDATTPSESFGTIISGLTIGNNYQIILEWQQCEYTYGGFIYRKGGELEVLIDGVPFVFYSNTTNATDLWQTASIVFQASNTNSQIIIRVRNDSGYGTYPESAGSIVVDAGITCNLVSINESQIYDNIKIVQNHDSQIITIELLNNFLLNGIKIYNISAKLIENITPTKYNKHINIDYSSYEKGFYIMQIQFENKILYKKFIFN